MQRLNYGTQHQVATVSSCILLTTAANASAATAHTSPDQHECKRYPPWLPGLTMYGILAVMSCTLRPNRSQWCMYPSA